MSCACPDRRIPEGSAECHCTGCSRRGRPRPHFSSPAAFDAHWQGSGDGRHCVDPATITYGSRSAKAGQPKFELRERAGGPVWAFAYEGEHPMAAKRRAGAAP